MASRPSKSIFIEFSHQSHALAAKHAQQNRQQHKAMQGAQDDDGEIYKQIENQYNADKRLTTTRFTYTF